jgi:hypothetical protein
VPLFLFWALACSPAADGDPGDAGDGKKADAGPADAGVEDLDGGGTEMDAGLPDAGGGTLPAGSACTANPQSPFARGDCAADLACFPQPETGLPQCTPLCGSIGDGGLVNERPERCDGLAGNDGGVLSCQTFSYVEGTGAVCMEPAPTRDGTCYALGDADGCAGEMSCLITDASQDDQGQLVIDQLSCKIACEPGVASGMDGGLCPQGESCFPNEGSPFVQLELSDPEDPDTRIACPTQACANNLATCPCSLDQGYRCTETGEGFFCSRREGVCGLGVEPVNFSDDFTEDGFLEFTALQKICNHVDDHVYCDPAFFDGVQNPGTLSCISGILGGNLNEGLCFATCSLPAAGAGQVPTEFNCPTNYTCEKDLGRTLLIASGIPDTSGPFGLKACDPSLCAEGQPCPGICGFGDFECITFDSTAQGEVSLCLAPYGSCEPLPLPDAGPLPMDAGPPPPTDSGIGGAAEAGMAQDGGGMADAASRPDAAQPDGGP